MPHFEVELPSPATCAMILAIALFCGGRAYRTARANHLNEPPLVSYWLPYIGNAISFGRNHIELFLKAQRVCPERQMASLTLMGHRVYVVLRARDVAAVYRAKELQFEDLIVWGLGTMFGLSSEGRRILSHDPCGPQSSLIFQSNPFFRQVLTEQEGLDNFTGRFLAAISELFVNLDKSLEITGGKKLTVNLLDWARTCMGTAATTAFMGRNILDRTPDLLQCGWRFEEDLSTFQSQYPEFLAPKAYANRERIIQAFLTAYHSKNKTSVTALGWLEETRNMLQAAGMTDRDIAIMNFGTWVAVNNNSNITMFWLLLHIAIIPGLADAIRRETADALLAVPLDTNQISNLPLFWSLFHETLRHFSTASSNRRVTNDVNISGYTLHKGDVVVTPASLQHHDPEVWGADAEEFVPDRFIRASNGSKIKGDVSWIRPFGGGVSLCPGRLFAQRSIMTVIALILQRYDIRVAKGQRVPALNVNASNIGMGLPVHDIEVQISSRL